jgi:hypothetical protein
MTLFWAALAALLLIGGATGLYLATPHQRLLARPPAAAWSKPAAMICAACALVILLMLMGPATAVFTWMTGLMLLWTIPPVVVGWLRHRQGGKA